MATHDELGAIREAESPEDTLRRQLAEKDQEIREVRSPSDRRRRHVLNIQTQKHSILATWPDPLADVPGGRTHQGSSGSRNDPGVDAEGQC